ncbi:uncharacterized protein LOC134195715 [Corticium candelabrum]|uniref:uncharacterized protein LOC134195715 n=1 Tax=Corticium candelabrum TaxID=121492 RepID=UPI002E260E8B|nr:uncharacterized protein LOC134195715 [Corticium candelabrum]
MAAVFPDGRLRHVEKDVLIAKLVKEEAGKRCHEYNKAFADCAKGRTISMVWKCRQLSQDLQNCIAEQAKDEQLWKECTEIYVKRRDEYQRQYKERKSNRGNQSASSGTDSSYSQ